MKEEEKERGGGGREEGGGGREEGGGGRGGEDCVTTFQGHTPTPPAYLFAGLLQLWLQGFQLSLHACHLVCG